MTFLFMHENKWPCYSNNIGKFSIVRVVKRGVKTMSANRPILEPDEFEEEKMGKFFRERLTELRMQKGVSENKMSLELGNSRSYINGIVSGVALPQMAQFFKICSYLDITPEEFFNKDLHEPGLIKELSGMMEQLSIKELESIKQLLLVLLEAKRAGERKEK